jgi:outer membrane protein assembly factor BamB
MHAAQRASRLRRFIRIPKTAKIDFAGGYFMDSSVVFVGIRGSVHCLNRQSGQTVWSARLKGSDYVTVLLDGELLLAATRGEVFCLQAATGKLLWHNDLPGQGLGLASIATATGSSNPGPGEEERRRKAAAAAAAVR